MMDKRTAVYTKGNGCCWYCGASLKKGKWHIDHFLPIVRDKITRKSTYPEREGFDNLVPACSHCNLLKGRKEIEDFRSYIPKVVSGLEKKSKSYITANNFGLVEKQEAEVIFHFEKMNY